MIRSNNLDKIIPILERHKNLIKVKHRGEFGYFFPDTNILDENFKIRTVLQAEKCLRSYLPEDSSDTIMVPVNINLTKKLYTVQAVSKTDVMNGGNGDLGTYEIDGMGKIKKHEG